MDYLMNIGLFLLQENTGCSFESAMATSSDNKVADMEMLSCHVCYDPDCLP